MAMRIGNDINQALSALDRQVQIAKNTASLAVIKDKHDKDNSNVIGEPGAELHNGEAAAEVEAVDGADAALGNHLDVEA